MMLHSKSMKSAVLAAMAWLMIAALACTMCACSGDETDPGANGTANDDANDDGGAGDAGGFVEPDDANEPIDPSMFEQVKSMWQTQVEGMAAQAQTLRQLVTEHPDSQLEELVKQVESKVAEAKSALEKATSPAQSRTLKVDVPRLVGEAGELTAKASARMQEVLRAKTGLGAAPPGGG